MPSTLLLTGILSLSSGVKISGGLCCLYSSGSAQLEESRLIPAVSVWIHSIVGSWWMEEGCTDRGGTTIKSLSSPSPLDGGADG